MVRSQIANLIFDCSFNHNLCFNHPNGPCKPILDIYVLRAFQSYRKIFNLMGFHPCNFFLKIWESIGTLTSQSGSSFESVEVHTLTLSHTPTLLGSMKCDPQASLLARTFMSPYFSCKPRVKVATTKEAKQIN